MGSWEEGRENSFSGGDEKKNYAASIAAWQTSERRFILKSLVCPWTREGKRYATTWKGRDTAERIEEMDELMMEG